MSITCHWIDTNNQKTEFTVTLLKPLKECTTIDFHKCAFNTSYDQLNNVAYVGTLPQKATENCANTVWFNTSDSIDFSTLHFSSKSTNKFTHKILILAVPQYTEISAFTIDTIPENVYIVSDVQSSHKLMLINSVQYRNDYLRTQLNFSKPLSHCLDDTVFNYENAASLITDGHVNYQLIPVFMYEVNDKVFITRNEPYSFPVIDTLNEICGFTDGIPCFNEPNLKLCLGVNVNDRQSAVPLSAGYCNNIIESVYGDMINIYSCSSTVNTDIKFSVYSEQSSYTHLQLQRGVLLNKECYTACASQYGFVFVNNITNEIYEPIFQDNVVVSCKELIDTKVTFESVSTKKKFTTDKSTETVNHDYYTVGVSANNRWQVLKHLIDDADNPVIVEDFGPKAVISNAYLTEEELPWLAVIRASDGHMYLKRIGAKMNTAILVARDVKNAAIYSTEDSVIVAYTTDTGVFVKQYHLIANGLIEATVEQLYEDMVDELEIKRIDDKIYINSYLNNKLKKSWLIFNGKD